MKVLGSVLVERLRDEDAGIVDEHIDPPEALLSLVDQVAGSRRFTNVTVDQQQVVGWSQRSRDCYTSRVRDYVEALGKEFLGQAESDAARGSSNDCCLRVFAIHSYTDGNWL